jgi:RimJ/RimL family protein N-acetyltransferase
MGAGDEEIDQARLETDRLILRSGRLIGEAIFKRLSDVEGEIGWAVAGPDQRQGLATEIGRALANFGFGDLRLHRLIARSEIGNHASERIMAKLGMVREGVLREHLFARGRWWTSAQWSMLASDRHPPSPAKCG